MDFDWKPQGPDWDLLQELEAGTTGRQLLDVEWKGLIERTGAGLGFPESEILQLNHDSDSRRRFVLEARRRIRDGSRRLGSALVAAHELADEGRLADAKDRLLRFTVGEPVKFYCELARAEMENLGGEASKNQRED